MKKKPKKKNVENWHYTTLIRVTHINHRVCSVFAVRLTETAVKEGVTVMMKTFNHNHRVCFSEHQRGKAISFLFEQNPFQNGDEINSNGGVASLDKNTINLHLQLEVVYLRTRPSNEGSHYESTPTEIYWKIHFQKLKVFRLKTLIFFIYLLKTSIVGTRSNRLGEAVLTITHNLCFWAEIRQIMYPL